MQVANRARRIAIAYWATGTLVAGLAMGAEAQLAILDSTDSAIPRASIEKVTCFPPLLGNRCLGISCLEDCDEPIPDLGEVTQSLNVPPIQFTAFGLKSCSINKLNFALELTHESVGDLRVSLEHQGTTVSLYDPPDACAAHAIDAVWSDRGAGPANACPATSSGTFLPDQPLAAFTGAQLGGVWTLSIEDHLAGNSGLTDRWRFVVDATCVLLAPPACVPGENVLCLGDENRYKIEAEWKTRQGTTGKARMVEITPETGYLWFFDPENVELVIKVLDGCDITQHYWVFVSGLTDVEVRLEVTDTKTGLEKTYFNPQRTPFQPIQDTSAFATCP